MLSWLNGCCDVLVLDDARLVNDLVRKLPYYLTALTESLFDFGVIFTPSSYL